MIGKLTQALFGRTPRYEMLTHVQFKGIALPVVDHALNPLGFERPGARMIWAAPAVQGIRPLFGLSFYKGAQVGPNWGLSLDYVPHLTGHKVAWHRTPKSARYDLFMSAPLGRFGDVPSPLAMGLDMAYGASHLKEQISHVIPMALSQAHALWQRASNVQALPDLFDYVTAERARLGAFPAEMYGQFHLARAFTLAQLGQRDAAYKAMQRWEERIGEDATPGQIIRVWGLFEALYEG